MLDAAASANNYSPFDFIKALYLYGPAAASVFCLVLIEPRARSQCKDSDIPRFVSIPVYACVWVGILGFLTLGIMYFFSMNATEATIKGQFNLAEKEQTIFSRKAAFFLKKEYGPGKPAYEFRIITHSKLKDGEVLPFLLDPGNGKAATSYDLPVKAEYYVQEVDIDYLPGPRNLFGQEPPGKLEVTAGSLRETLEPRTDAAQIRDVRPPSLEGLLRIREVHAQAGPRIEVLLKDLDSADPIVRQDGRDGLSSLQQAALPAIEKILANRSASYLSTLGCIAALAGMKGADLENLSPNAFGVITNAANSGDTDLGVVYK